MDPKTKNTIIGVTVALVLILIVIGIVVLVKFYKDGKFDKHITALKTRIYGPMLSTIYISKSAGIIELTRVYVYDDKDQDITNTTEWESTANSMYNTNGTHDPSGVISGNNQYHSVAPGENEWVRLVAKEPLRKVKKVVVVGNPTWLSRWKDTSIVITASDGSTMATHTVNNTATTVEATITV